MIVVFGSINLDLIFRVPALPLAGQTVASPSLRVEPGGKGANQALAAARDGAHVVFAGAVGRDRFAADALRLMRAAGIDLSRVAGVDAATGVASICVDDAGQNLIAVASGANLHARAAWVEDELLRPDTTLLLQMEVDPAETTALIYRAKARGARVILNLAPAASLSRSALESLDLLIANEDEAAWLASHLGTEPSALRDTLGCDIAVTLGAQGVRAQSAAGGMTLPAHKVAVVDTTAAGDCFSGVLAAGLDQGLGLDRSLSRATVAAALCCSRPGTQTSLPVQHEIDEATRLVVFSSE